MFQDYTLCHNNIFLLPLLLFHSLIVAMYFLYERAISRQKFVGFFLYFCWIFHWFLLGLMCVLVWLLACARGVPYQKPHLLDHQSPITFVQMRVTLSFSLYYYYYYYIQDAATRFHYVHTASIRNTDTTKFLAIFFVLFCLVERQLERVTSGVFITI